MKGGEEGKAEEGRVPFLFLTSSPGLTEQMKPFETRNNVWVKISRARLGSEVFLHPLRVRRSPPLSSVNCAPEKVQTQQQKELEAGQDRGQSSRQIAYPV